MDEKTKKRITEELEVIEKKENIKILFAVESGSRAWGFESKDSDFDVRFIYIRPLDWYVSISKKRDTLEFMIDETLDIAGWDLNKALELLGKSNPALGEWLNSKIIYKEIIGIKEELKKLFDSYLREDRLVYHYLSMASKDLKILSEYKKIKLKKYFYILRALLASKWILKFHNEPPILFRDLLNLIKEKSVLGEIELLLEIKKTGDEKSEITENKIINNFIFNLRDEVEKDIKNIVYVKNNNLSVLDKFFVEKVSYYNNNFFEYKV